MIWAGLRAALQFAGLLVAISLLAFALLELSPTDPAQMMLQASAGAEHSPAQEEALYQHARRQLGLDLPAFYVSIVPADEPDTLFRLPPEEQTACRAWLYRTGQWHTVAAWRNSLHRLQMALFARQDSLRDEWLVRLKTLRVATEPADVQQAMEALAQSPIATLPEAAQVQSAAQKLLTINPIQPYRHFVPRMVWYGFHNRYHLWLAGIFRGDWGISYYTGQPVRDRLSGKMAHTAWLAAWAIGLVFLFGILMGTLAAAFPHTLAARALDPIAGGMAALPTFGAGALLLLLLANPDVISLFPASFLPESEGISRWFGLHWVLPLVAYTYGSWTRLSLLVRASVSEALQQDYIRTARAKGNPQWRVLWVHALRNSLIPIAVAFGGVLPTLLGGSVVIEQMFGIPGLAPEMLQAVQAADMPIVAASVLLLGAATAGGYWLTGVLAAWADPRSKVSA